MRDLFIDIETYSEVDIKKSGSYKYIEDDSFEILLITYAIDNNPVKLIDMTKLGEFDIDDDNFDEFEKAYETHILHAHNANFERNALDKFFGYKTPINRWHCTMALTASCGLPLSLDKVSEVLQLENAKLKSGKALITYFTKPCKPTKANGMRTRNLPHHAPEKWTEFGRYCCVDTEAEREIFNLLKYHVPTATERQCYILDQQINDFGVGVDLDLAKAAIEIDEKYKSRLTERVIALTGVDNPGSRNQLMAWLNGAMDSEVTTLRKADIPELLKATDCPEVAEVLKARQGLSKTSTKKYVAMIDATCKDSRAHGLLQYYGANRTGRFAGRLIQVQNLPQNHLDPLDFARDLAKNGDIDGIELYYGDPADTLSQLIRTSFVPQNDNVFAIADFSAIEARVIAWVADEQWRLDVFKTHGKIYEASASMMFGVPIEQITKGNPLRAQGKVAELACGFGGGVGALERMDTKKELKPEQMQPIIDAWRKKSPNIVKLWYKLDNAFKEALKTGIPQRVGVKGSPNGLMFRREHGNISIELPSGRKLFYWKPSFTVNKFGSESVQYWGLNQTTKQWEQTETYGGKITENCLAGDTLVLTDGGWKPITKVRRSNKVWDGEEWVTHSGLSRNGLANTIEIDGVRLTEDHLILTDNGWKKASQSEGHYRNEITFLGSDQIFRFRRKEIYLGNKMRLRKDYKNARKRIYERKTEILRMYEEQFDRKEQQYSQIIGTPILRSVEINESEMFKSETQSVEELRRTRNNRVRKMGRKFRKFLGGYERILSNRLNFGANKQRERLLSGKLQMGNSSKTSSEQKSQCIRELQREKNNSSRSIKLKRNKKNYIVLPYQPELPGRPFIRQSGRYEQVYDLVNCGKNNRFLVKGKSGTPFVVHNCIQAIARDLLMECMLKVNKKYPITMHIHDELVAELSRMVSEEGLRWICDKMAEEIEWAKGLPLRGEGFTSNYYKKD